MDDVIRTLSRSVQVPTTRNKYPDIDNIRMENRKKTEIKYIPSRPKKEGGRTRVYDLCFTMRIIRVEKPTDTFVCTGCVWFFGSQISRYIFRLLFLFVHQKATKLVFILFVLKSFS